MPPSLSPREAFELAAGFVAPGRARYYGPADGAAIGTGLILTNVEFPTYLRAEGAFGVLRGLVLVLTHECDLDQGNERLLNDVALVCPIIEFGAFVDDLNKVLDYESAKQLIGNISARYVNRVAYLPSVPGILPFGGYLYLNQLTNTHLSKLTAMDAKTVCMLSVDGMRELDFALKRHLFRPKVDRMPFEVRA